MISSEILLSSVQINDGFTDTSADGANMAFDKKYGIMFCVYMPGRQGCYGESRGRIALAYFPAAQPTNRRSVIISEGADEYLPNILGLGDGRVRVFYEKDSHKDGDHLSCYRDFDFLSGTLGDEKTVMLKREDGSTAPLCQSEHFRYLEARGYKNHVYNKSEQATLGGTTFFRQGDLVYGATSAYLAEPILYRSSDDLATVEFFAVCPYSAQYEFDYKMLDGKIYALYRTEADVDSIFFTTSDDGGESWSVPSLLRDSVACRPRVILHLGRALLCYNYYNSDTKHRQKIQQGRTSVRILRGVGDDISEYGTVADLYSKYGIVNVCLADILGDVYLAYSTSVLALEYQNGNRLVRGKDAIRYLNLGDLSI